MRGPEPATRGKPWEEAWSSCRPKPHTPPLCGLGPAFPRQETLVNMKREREGSRGKKSIPPHSFPSLPQWSVGNSLRLMSKCLLLRRQERQGEDEASCHGRPRDPTDVCAAWQGSLLGRKERLSPSIRVISPCFVQSFTCSETLLHRLLC